MRTFSLSTLTARFALVGLALFSLAACKKSGDAPADDAGDAAQFTLGAPIADSTVALVVTVAGRTDTLAADAFFQQYFQTLQQNPFVASDSLQARELRRSIAEGYVFQNVLRALADKETGLTVDTTQADAYIANLRQQAQAQGASFEDELSRAGLTPDSLRALLVEQLRVQALAERLAERAPQPTAAEIADYRQEQAEEVRLQHILLLKNPGLSAQQTDSLRRRAEAVLDSARKGIDFAALARRNSQAGNAAMGGDMDYVSRSAGIPEKVADAAFALRDSGDVSPTVVESPFGYHIFRLTGRRMGTPMDTLTARGNMMQKRRGETVENAVKDALKTLGVTVRVNPDVVEADLNAPLED